jgi:hypothetical protein
MPRRGAEHAGLEQSAELWVGGLPPVLRVVRRFTRRTGRKGPTYILRGALCVLVLAVVSACESGTSLRLAITVHDDATAGFSAEVPAIFRIKTESVAPFTLGAICEENLSLNAREFIKDFGFGCLDDSLAGRDEVVTGWIEPLPDGFDAAALCANGSTLGDEIEVPVAAGVDPPPELPTEPDDDDAQGSGVVAWQRDLSPCGGQGRGELEVGTLF